MREDIDQKSTEIIGWGLAGAVLSWQLYFRNQKFMVYDSLSNHTTRVAAGMVNPIVFKRLTKSWNADILLPYSENFYSRIEKLLDVKFVSNKSIFRVFASVEEENNWSSKQGDERFQHYLATPTTAEMPSSKFVNSPFGMGKVNTIGSVDTNLFLDRSKAFFQENNIQFVDEIFKKETLAPNVRYFFCEGTSVSKNPWFKDLPLKPTHGETLVIETDDLKFDQTVNKNMFLMHVEGNRYRVGATYNWELTDPIVTEEGKLNLQERLAAFTNFEYKIVEHTAGIRPTVKDRRPMLGVHATQKNAIVFNGLGTKGVMIGPYYAEHLVRHVFDGDALDREVDIQRFQK
jgi:hypothetical protein